MRNSMSYLIGKAIRKGFPIGVIGRANLSGDRKARGHRKADRGHAVQIRALAAEQVLIACAIIVDTAAKTENILGHRAAGSFVAI
jgi:hypothetical protein